MNKYKSMWRFQKRVTWEGNEYYVFHRVHPLSGNTIRKARIVSRFWQGTNIG